MGYNDPDVYNQPEKFGLTQVAMIDWDDEPYQFDMTVVWLHRKTNRLYMASDSGCSCPSPFEDYKTMESLEALESISQIEAMVKEHREAAYSPTPSEKCDAFLAEVKEAMGLMKRRGRKA